MSKQVVVYFVIVILMYHSIYSKSDIHTNTTTTSLQHEPDPIATITYPKPENCNPGNYYDSASKTCKTCPENTFNPANYAKQCVPCPTGAYGPGASGLKSFNQCHCAVGFYLDETHGRCAACPSASGTYLCPGFLGCNHPSLQETGWFPIKGQGLITSSAIYQRCPVKDSCPPISCTSDEVSCVQGHGGVLCFNCIADYDRQLSNTKSLCSTCSSAFLAMVLFSLSVIGAFLLSLVLANISQHELARRVAELPQASFSQAKVAFLAVLINLALSVGGLSVNLNFGSQKENQDEIGLVVSYANTMFSSSLNAGLLIDALRLGCISRSVRQLLFASWTPPALAVATYILWLVVHLRRIKRSPNAYRGGQVPLSFETWVAFSGLDCTAYCASMMFWIYILVAPIMTRYCSLALSCTISAVLDSRLVLSPGLECGSLKSAFAGIFLVSSGIPLGFSILLFFKKRRLATSVKAKVRFGALTDGYRESYGWVAPIKLLLLHTVIFVSMIIPDVLIRTKLTVMLIILMFTFAIHHMSQPFRCPDVETPSRYKYWKIWKRIRLDLCIQDQNKLESIGIFATSVSYLFLIVATSKKHKILTWACVFCAIPIQWIPIMALLIEVVVEDFSEDLQWMAHKVVKAIPPPTKKPKDCRGMLSAVLQMKQRVQHNLGEKAEQNFHYCARISICPAEVLAQLHCIIKHGDFGILPMNMVPSTLIEKGHLEIMGTSLIVAVPKLQYMFRDVSSEIITSSEFRQQVHLCLNIVAEKLGITHLVRIQEWKAAKIAKKYSLAKRMVKPKEVKTTTNWKDILDVKRDGDVRTRWLAAQKDFRRLEDINRTQADFKFLFPSASPAATQSEKEKPKENDVNTADAETKTWVQKLGDFL